jgi:hypothetical protein
MLMLKLSGRLSSAAQDINIRIYIRENMPSNDVRSNFALFSRFPC